MEQNETKKTVDDVWNPEAWTKLLGEVPYHYCNRVAMNMNQTDIRVAFADEVPGRLIVPKVGIVLSHPMAVAVRDLLDRNIKTMEAAMNKTTTTP